jgi:two-component system, LytTR family, response regulator
MYQTFSMKILIVEDDPFVADDLKGKLQQLNYRVTAIAESYDEALKAIESERPDLALLDIELNGELTGIDLAEKLAPMSIPYIYLSSIQDLNTYSLARSTGPLKNLAKPIDVLNLRNALMDIDLGKSQSAHPIVHLITERDGNKLSIDPNDILYVLADRTYCDIHFNSMNRATLTMSMGDFIEKLNWSDIIRIHRSHSINLKYVKRLRGNEVEMVNGELLRIGDSYKEFLYNHLKMY